jgi:uncharacterized protein
MSSSLMPNNPPLPATPESTRLSPPSQPAANDPNDPNAEIFLAAQHLVTAQPPAPNPLQPTRSDSPLRELFIGPNGLYPGTRWLIYLALVFVVFQLEGWVVMPFHSRSNTLSWRFIGEAIMMFAAIIPGFIMARIEGCPFGDFGLPARRAFRGNFWVGALWGVVSVTILILILRLAGAFEFGGLSIHGARIWKFALYYAIFFLFTGFFEDFLMRGYSQWVLSKGMHFWPTAALLSIAFGSIHSMNPGEAKTGLVAAGCIGFFLCLTLRRTGDLWFAVGFHMAWDWSESYLYAVPDSGAVLPGHLLKSSLHGPDWLTGGSVGPEGSYLVFAIIGALWVLFSRTHPEAKYRN